MIVSVAESSQVGHARRRAIEEAKSCGFNDEKIGRIALVATELATNLVKHAGRGDILLNRFGDVDGRGLELLALDKGPGIADLQRAMADGYSTAGSLGTGLGSVERGADRFAIYSRPGLGAAVMARFACGPSPEDRADVAVSAVVEPYPGEYLSGDAWAYAGRAPAGQTILVVDGSGHGEQAARAAKIASETFLAHCDLDCVPLVETLHRALAPTRGAAVAIARVDRKAGLVRFVGVGNISAAILSEGQLRHMVSQNGTAGHVAPRIREFTYPFARSPLIVLHSDGLSARWDFAAYPGLGAAHPALVAGVLFRDFRRGRDDSSIVAWAGSA